MEAYSLENLGCFWYCFTRFVLLSRFGFIAMALLFGELMIEFLLDGIVPHEVHLFWGATLLVLLLCHSLLDPLLVFFGKNISTVGGTRTLRTGCGRGDS